MAYRRYSTDYVAAENEARKAKRGMWRGTFCQTVGVVGIVAAAANAGTFIKRLISRHFPYAGC